MFKNKGKKRSLQAKKKQFRRTGSSFTKSNIKNNDNDMDDTSKDDKDKVVVNDNDEDDDDEEESTMQTILKTRKRRMILQNMEQSRGIPTNALLQSSTTSTIKQTTTTTTTTTTTATSTKSSLTQSINEMGSSNSDRLDMNKFGISVLGEGAGNVDDHSNSVMGAKHKEALERYIRDKQQESSNPNHQSFHSNASKSNDSSNTKDNKTNTTTSQLNIAAKEGDVGAGGAMLGGTGIAEVILPLDHRIQNIRETEEAAQIKEDEYQRRYNRHGSTNHNTTTTTAAFTNNFTNTKPLNFHSFTSSVPSTSTSTTISTPSASSAGKNVLPSDVSNVGTSYSHNFQLHNQDWIQKKQQENDFEKKQMEEKWNASRGQYLDSDANRERVGFEALRRSKMTVGGGTMKAVVGTGARNNGTGGGNAKNGEVVDDAKTQFYQRSNDDRVWGTFVKNQKSRGRL